jgi:hypothetical protein
LASWATPQAHSTREAALSGAMPNATFSRTLAENRNVSWGTKPTAPRRTESGSRRTSCPSTSTLPEGA